MVVYQQNFSFHIFILPMLYDKSGEEDTAMRFAHNNAKNKYITSGNN